MDGVFLKKLDDEVATLSSCSERLHNLLLETVKDQEYREAISVATDLIEIKEKIKWLCQMRVLSGGVK